MRTAMFMAVCLSVLLVPPSVPAAQEVQPPSGWQQEGPEAHAEQFLSLMVAGKLDQAFDTLLGTSRTQSMDKLKFEIFTEYKKSGNPVGYEQVLKQYAGKSLLRLRYILLFKNMPRMFDIYYYNPEGKGWKLRTFSYVPDIKKIFIQ